jgi:hypothetical protein
MADDEPRIAYLRRHRVRIVLLAAAAISCVSSGACASEAPRASEHRASSDTADSYERADDRTADTTSAAAATVIRRYYDAIRAAQYDSAYALWRDEGRASGQSRAEFAAGFAETAEVRVAITDSVRVEGAAGSQYATVPVAVDAVLRDGRRQHFEGAYTLRRAAVDGATPAQRQWHIASAKLRPA